MTRASSTCVLLRLAGAAGSVGIIDASLVARGTGPSERIFHFGVILMDILGCNSPGAGERTCVSTAMSEGLSPSREGWRGELRYRSKL